MDCLTKSDQLLLAEMHNNKGVITKCNQKTFNAKFYQSANKLIKLGLIRYRIDKKDNRIKVYCLTDNGKFFSKVILGQNPDVIIWYF